MSPKVPLTLSILSRTPLKVSPLTCVLSIILYVCVTQERNRNMRILHIIVNSFIAILLLFSVATVVSVCVSGVYCMLSVCSPFLLYVRSHDGMCTGVVAHSSLQGVCKRGERERAATETSPLCKYTLSPSLSLLPLSFSLSKHTLSQRSDRSL